MNINRALKELCTVLLSWPLGIWKTKGLPVATLSFVIATSPLYAQTGWVGRYLVLAPGSNQVQLSWAANPAYLYRVESTTNLALPFAAAQDIPTNLQTQTNYISLNVPMTGQSRFFRLVAYDAQGPHVDDQWPADGTYGIGVQEGVRARITSAAPLNLNSLRMTVAGQTVLYGDSRLAFASNYVTFTPKTNDFLGAAGEKATVGLYVEDTSGYGTLQSWSFHIAQPLVLRSNVVMVDTGSLVGNGPHLTLQSQLSTNTFVYSYSGGILSGLSDAMVLMNTNNSPTNNQSYGRMVLSHQDNPTNRTVTVTTRPAGLGEMFRGSLRVQVPITSTVSPGPNLVGGSKPPIAPQSTPFHIDCQTFGNQVIYQDQIVTLQTSPGTRICLDGDLDADLDYNQYGIPDGGHAIVDITATGELALELTAQDSWDSGDQSIQIASFPVPISDAITLNVTFYLDYHVFVNGYLALTAGAGYTEQGQIGYDSDPGPVLGVGPATFPPIFNLGQYPDYAITAYAKAGLRAAISTTVIDVVMVSADVKPYIQGNLNLYCWDPQDNPQQAAAQALAEIFSLGAPFEKDPGFYLDVNVQAGMDGDVSLGVNVPGVFTGGGSYSDQIIPPKYAYGPYDTYLGAFLCVPSAPPPPSSQSHMSLPGGTAHTGLVELRTSVPSNQVPAFRWARRVGSIYLPLSDDSHTRNTTGSTLYIQNPQPSDGGTYVLAAKTPGGVGLSETDVGLLPPAPQDPTLSSYASSFAWIPPGSFLMGSPTNEPERASDETQHTVTISRGFYIGRYEVSQADFLQIMGTNPSQFQSTSNLPVDSVTWGQASNYCRLLTLSQRAAGLIPNTWSYSLPTESQWEYVCRTNGNLSGGLVTPRTTFSTGPDLLGFMGNFAAANEYESSLGTLSFLATPYLVGHTTPLGTYPPSVAGVYDLAGNLAEWCSDAYGPYPTNSVIDPTGALSGTNRVYRGGGWSDAARNCRAACRASAPPTSAMSNVGFRIVLSGP